MSIDTNRAVPAGERLSTVPTQRGAAPEPPPSLTLGRRLHRALVIGDVICVALAITTAWALRIGFEGDQVVSGDLSVHYLTVSLLLAVAWPAALTATRSRDRRVMGQGGAEYQRVWGATWRLFAVVAVVAFLLHADVARAYLAIAAPLGLGLLIAWRALARRRLHQARAQGRGLHDVVVVGPREKVARFPQMLGDGTASGYRVVAACVPHGAIEPDEHVAGVPVLGGLDDVRLVAETAGARMVLVLGSDAVSSQTVRQLGWDLEGTGIDLALSLALVDVAGPRMTVQPVSGLPWAFVDEPRFTGWRYVLKNLFDLLGAGIITLLLSPVLLAVAAIIKITSPGPVLYRQERIGKDGQPFPMLKFRSMVVDADKRLAEVLAAEGREVGMFYKPVNDPRVTPIGRFIRRYSIDELPQLFNVLRGEMSLVGPRPQIQAEVDLYDRAAFRRLLVKPGLTGLWQVSGRSDLSPEESIRLDVRYVENWSGFGDMMILARTAKAVVAGEGAR
ncbi:sugar transferase [Cellulomonas palmilytica]|uniref:sugar transferase n=1 Tax=Cellulomonas palmilytica TaxID=2608402 RepID=UPI001F210175|nr:sugar transferase [Cellulomonas palmilytica]UJP41008.1 sugar transferase [Cellulomonas palmilytica]